mgnify:CR=1 FL=1
MKKLLIALTLTASMAQSFAAAGFLAGLHDQTLALGGMLTSTTVSVYASPLAGLVVFLEDGSQSLNLGSPEAVEMLQIAVENTNAGEASAEDISTIEIYATAQEMTSSEVIAAVTAEL